MESIMVEYLVWMALSRVMILGVGVNPKETVNISLTQVGGSSADLIGAAVTITDDDTSETILTATWDGNTITTEIPMGTYYTVSVEAIEGYLLCSDKSYLAGYQTTRNIVFKYMEPGAYIEATDGTLYTASTWASSGKTANAVVVLTDVCKVRIALTMVILPIHSNSTDPLENYLTPIPNEASARVDYDGEGNTNKIIQFNIAYGTNTTSYAAPYCKAFSFTYPQGKKGCLPSLGQLLTLYQNTSLVNDCLAACDGTAIGGTSWDYSSSFYGNDNNIRRLWVTRGAGGVATYGGLDTIEFAIRPVSAYE